ncbi:MAG: BMP family ABC transporter substrate-binding protein [Oscillospiraceae bacterium]|jgi:hypothetical protein|nr:BMP family ABC transporter substrate-binding protein [Oscillospiraceae bacterium]
MPEVTIDTLEAYRAARKQGRKFAAERRGKERGGFLPVLEVSRLYTLGEVKLGTYEIPLGKIAGTATAGRSGAFAANFLPLLPETTEFSQKWQAVYRYSAESGINDPVKVVEYLGYYYAVEGNKRISVSVFNDAYSVPAEVTRLLPAKEEGNTEVEVFFELLQGDNRRPIGHMWFSKEGRYSELLHLSGKDDNDKAIAYVNEQFTSFRKAYHSCGFASLGITTGDAFFAYVTVYGFPEDMTAKDLEQQVKTCRPRFESAVAPPPKTVTDDPSRLITKSSFFDIFNRIPHILFIYCDMEKHRWWTNGHRRAELILRERDNDVEVRSLILTGEMSEQTETATAYVKTEKPDIVFVTDQKHSALAMRLAMDNPKISVFHCTPETNSSLVPTYYGKSEDAAFLCGLVAGAVTRTNTVGYLNGQFYRGMLMRDPEAFAQGVKTVRPSARVCWLEPNKGEYNKDGVPKGLASLAEKQCDVVFTPVYDDDSRVYCELLAIAPDGSLINRYVTATYDWCVFYTRLLGAVGKADLHKVGSTYHFRMGVASELITVRPVNLAEGTSRLLANYKYLLGSGTVEPLDENFNAEIIW